MVVLLSFFMFFLSILQPDMGKKSKYKTSVKKKTLNPEFNEVKVPFTQQIITKHLEASLISLVSEHPKTSCHVYNPTFSHLKCPWKCSWHQSACFQWKMRQSTSFQLLCLWIIDINMLLCATCTGVFIRSNPGPAGKENPGDLGVGLRFGNEQRLHR